MTSEDVIHDLFFPAFRIKADVIPGRYTSIWFHPTKAGRYHLFCAEYCGTKHSGMVGSVVVMSGYTEETLTGLESNAELLQKPFSPKDLRLRVRAALDQRTEHSR